tara:strand:- start:142 stop:486 length:345 start_codon:yes stop_codon:yes gene_type:complete
MSRLIALCLSAAVAIVAVSSAQASELMGTWKLKSMAITDSVGGRKEMARELSPQGLHIAHFVIDGVIRGFGTSSDSDDRMLDPDAIAETYHAVHKQHRSVWSWEVELRPWGESF